MQCSAIAKDGNHCLNEAVPGYDYCHMHLQNMRLRQAPLRALVLSTISLVAVLIAWYFFPELEPIVSCGAILVAILFGLGVIATKLRRIE
jgi:peptidoglycan/LPS O-acetylase OafA/YrhL